MLQRRECAPVDRHRPVLPDGCHVLGGAVALAPGGPLPHSSASSCPASRPAAGAEANSARGLVAAAHLVVFQVVLRP